MRSALGPGATAKPCSGDGVASGEDWLPSANPEIVSAKALTPAAVDNSRPRGGCYVLPPLKKQTGLVLGSKQGVFAEARLGRSRNAKCLISTRRSGRGRLVTWPWRPPRL